MSTEKAIQLVPAQPLAVVPAEVNSAAMLGMVQQVIKSGVTADNALAIEKLLGLCERMQDRQAEQEFARAFVALQNELPRIQASKGVPNNDGTLRYKFAPYEEIMRQVRPVLTTNGFTITFSQEIAEGRITAICRLTHTGGHSRENKFAVRIGKGPPGSSEAQGDGAASTYAKRFALCNALNITIESDTDAHAEGTDIPAEKAEELEKRVAALNRDPERFLKWLGATKFADIQTGRLAEAEEWLAKAERIAMAKMKGPA